MKTGIDLSEWNGNINFSKVNVDFAILRVGYGVSYMPNSQKDSKFEEYYAGLKGKMPLGVYYYAYATNREQGIKEADNCLAYMGNKKLELPIFYDLEEPSNTRAAAEGFIARMREKGHVVGIYCSSYFYGSKLAGISTDWVWIADWGNNNGKIPSSQPKYAYDIWQYTSEGRVDGISGRVDMNVARDGVIPGTTPTPAPTPSPTPTPSGDSTIRKYQAWLNKFPGVKIDEDGYFGQWTKKAALITLQDLLNRDYGTKLVVDGIWGAKTKAACGKVALRKGNTGDMVHNVQGMLYCYGYDTNGVDGIFGDGTEKAVKKYQKAKRITVDGIVGQDTLTKLFN